MNKNTEDTVQEIKSALRGLVATSGRAPSTFFKTGKGEYAEHDRFLGVRVPDVRVLAKEYRELSLDGLQKLLDAKINEERLLALIIMTHQYKKGDADKKEQLFDFYCKNTDRVNNWNLVDSSAHLIVGAHLWDKKRDYLLELAESPILWERRIAIVATWFFIKKGELLCTFKLAQKLLHDEQDLMHKAVGWMMREAGKKEVAPLLAFLDTYASCMPRTMLRYAIEKLSEEQRMYYLGLKLERQNKL